jgi:hypothetical protein
MHARYIGSVLGKIFQDKKKQAEHYTSSDSFPIIQTLKFVSRDIIKKQ